MRPIGAFSSVVYSAGERRLFLAKKIQRGDKPGDKPCSAARSRKHTKLREQQDGFVS